MDTFQALQKDLNDLKNSSFVDFDDHYNVNTRRGNYLRRDCHYESGPKGLHHISGYSPNNSNTSINSLEQPFELVTNSFRPISTSNAGENNELPGVNNSSATSTQRMSNQVFDTKKSETAVSGSAQTKPPMSHGTSAHSKVPMSRCDGDTAQIEPRMCPRESQTSDTSMADKLKAPRQWQREIPSEEWKLVQRKRFRNRIVGKKGTANTDPNGKFKAADINVPLFIYNVDKSTAESDIIAHVYNKTQQNVTLQKLNLKFDKGYNAFKILVPKSKLDVFLGESFWPEGVLFRRFVNFSNVKNKKLESQNNGK